MTHVDLPSNLGPDELVPAINDALRRLASQASTTSTTASSGSTFIVPSNQYQTDITLTANTAVASPGTLAGVALWLVRITQDATGGWAVFWGADVHFGPNINATFNADPNTICTMIFASFSGDWYLVAQPILGVLR